MTVLILSIFSFIISYRGLGFHRFFFTTLLCFLYAIMNMSYHRTKRRATRLHCDAKGVGPTNEISDRLS